MAKYPAQSMIVVRNAKTGQSVSVRGVGSLKDSKLPLQKGIDLTKPIASQTLETERKKG